MAKSKREKRDSEGGDSPLKKRIKSEDLEEEVGDQTTEDISVKDSRDLTQLSYEEKIPYTSVIAKPMATKKLAKRLFKLMKKAAKMDRKNLLRIGLKDVQLKIRKGLILDN